jgi:hypothetical protein
MSTPLIGPDFMVYVGTYNEGVLALQGNGPVPEE